MCGRSQDEEDMQASLTETVADDGAPRRRGRKRFLPVMNNSERARYYRRKDAQELAAKKAVVRDLRRDIDSLRFQRRLHRHLIEHSIAEIPRYQIVNQVAAFVASRLEKLVPELQKCQYEIQGMEISGDPTGLVLRLECTLSGRLLPSVVRRIYPYVLGNSVALSRMMHSDMEYPCYYSCQDLFRIQIVWQFIGRSMGAVVA
ncbi:hypothetical protein Poli38472_006976 [Pythium oligandrum]|uniref:Uncharacterized protein n=1 Tax=Pythium oligandrum TaxID=41045 RepID=A0A8K1FDX6_PYTOL|nr:hypothetical protein Poli38472_006976 [Pythium oligandrum]|eukprot:TMW58831.1 hypothetical protein Poli38472_006976 [Pythium oligandrum]